MDACRRDMLDVYSWLTKIDRGAAHHTLRLSVSHKTQLACGHLREELTMRKAFKKRRCITT